MAKGKPTRSGRGAGRPASAARGARRRTGPPAAAIHALGAAPAREHRIEYGHVAEEILEETLPLEQLEAEPEPSREPRAWVPRLAASAALVAAFVVVPVLLPDTDLFRINLAMIYAIVGLSMNQLLGYVGQISLGHQAFVGVGAFMAAYLVVNRGTNFWVALVAAALMGGVSGGLLGAVSLRLRGLYFALVTLAYGFLAENTIFQIKGFTGGGAGLLPTRPAAFKSEQSFFFLVTGVWAVLLFLDWRLVKSKAGRAIQAIRDDERVAAVNGINIPFYKVVAFSISGAYAGVAGALFAHWREAVQAADFSFTQALTFVLMVVVGGLNSRAGVLIGSWVFALLNIYLADRFPEQVVLIPAFGALLLLLTLIFFPGGIGQQIRPVTDWFAGKPFTLRRHGGGR